MAPPLQNNKAYHVLVFNQTGDADPMITTLATEWTSGSETLTALATRVGNAWNTRIRTLQHTSYIFQRIDTIGRDSSGTETAAVVLYGNAGGGGGNALPPNVATLVKKNTGLRGRKNRGRMYVPGLAGEGDVDNNGFISGASLGTFQTAFTNFFNDLDGATPVSDIMLLHEDNSLATRVSSLEVENLVATQRRRLR